MLGSATVVAQKAERELSKNFAAAAPFHRAAGEDMVVRSILTDSGEIAIVVEMPNIQTRTSRRSGLPNESRVGSWSVRFTLVPKVPATEMRELRKQVDEIPHDKTHLTMRGLLEQNLAHVATDTYAYRVTISSLVPTGKSELASIKAFTASLAKSLSVADGADEKVTLETLLVQ